LSIAIGKRGQNVRLASKLTKWHLDVISEERYSQTMRDGYDSLVSLPGISISMADLLYEKGFFSAEELAKATEEDLLQIRGIDEEAAAALIQAVESAGSSGENNGQDHTPETDAAPEQPMDNEEVAESEAEEIPEPVEHPEPAVGDDPVVESQDSATASETDTE